MTPVVTGLLERLRLRSQPVVPTPSDEDVEWYLERREAMSNLYGDLLGTIPRRATREIASARGDGVCEILFLGSEEMVTPHIDCCLHEWIVGGKSVVQRYAEESPPPEGTEERDTLDALLRARFAVLKIGEQVPGAGAHAVDMLTDQELFLMDVALSFSRRAKRSALVGRIMPVGEFWMSAGGALPMPAREARKRIEKLAKSDPAVTSESFDPEALDGRSRLFERHENVLAFVRMLLEDDPDTAVLYVAVNEIFSRVVGADSSRGFEAEGRGWTEGLTGVLAPFEGRRPTRNGPCPCGSGQKYKRCCGRERPARLPA